MYNRGILQELESVLNRGSLLVGLGVECVGSWYIPGNVPSSKNSKRIVGGVNGRPYLIGSKQLFDYKKSSGIFWKQSKSGFREALIGVGRIPLLIEFTFIRASKHKFDYINPAQTVQDLMVEYDWIDDDNSDVMVPYFGDYIYSKETSGVVIRLFNGKKKIEKDGTWLKRTEQEFCKRLESERRQFQREPKREVLVKGRSGSSAPGSPGGENDRRESTQTEQTDQGRRSDQIKDFYIGC